MAFLKTIYDIANKTWSIDTSDAGFDWNEIQINFYSENNAELDISDLEFGFYLKKKGEEILSSHHPIHPIKYEKSKTAIMHVVMVQLVPNEEYYLEAYARNLTTKENVDTKSATFTTPLRPKKFESWTWNDSIKDWEAPIPHPDPVNGVDDPVLHKLYQWSESRGQWIEGLPEEVQD
jgi:hypothetical protein